MGGGPWLHGCVLGPQTAQEGGIGNDKRPEDGEVLYLGKPKGLQRRGGR